MVAAVRSELVRLLRPRLLLGWLGLTALFAILVNTVMFGTAGQGTQLPPGAPGVAFPPAERLVEPTGIVAGVAAASSMFGIVTLAVWAIATATDHGSGLIRSLVAAEPRRWRLLVGKVIALVLLTSVATAAAVGVGSVAALPSAQAAGIDTSAWGTDLVTVLSTAWRDALAAQLVWGVIGLVLAVLSRSSAVAISIGVGYVLVIESVVGMIDGLPTDRLPGATIQAIAAGGTDAIPYGTALTLGLAYGIVGLTVALVVASRRDVTD